MVYLRNLTSWAMIAICFFGWWAPAHGAELEEAQLAANEGRYSDVVNLLTGVLEEKELDEASRVVAHSNRGIAYSLLNAYALARKDLNSALKLNPDHALTMNHLGLLAEQVEKDYGVAADYYERASALGFSASRVNLAKLFMSGRGVPQTDEKAFELLQQAALEEYAMAYTPLGEMMAEGKGTKRNSRAAVAMFQKSASAGIADGQYALADAYERGVGVGGSNAKAAEYYLKAAVQGHGRAQNSLGYLYRRGSGVPQNFLEAAKWYRLAADQGVPSAMNRLAWLLAGCPEPEICNGELAVELVQRAFEQKDFNEADRASYEDSLAAGYARSGQFDMAIETMTRTLSNLRPGDRQYAGFARRLALYQTGIPKQL